MRFHLGLSSCCVRFAARFSRLTFYASALFDCQTFEIYCALLPDYLLKALQRSGD